MIRTAKLADVPAIRDLINSYAELERMLFRSLAEIYETLRNFRVCELDGKIVGCCALQVMWSDLAEVKSLVVHEDYQGQGIGAQLVQAVLEDARQLGLPKVFALTLEKNFFEKIGFHLIKKEELPMKVWSDCVSCPKQDHCDEIAVMKVF